MPWDEFPFFLFRWFRIWEGGTVRTHRYDSSRGDASCLSKKKKSKKCFLWISFALVLEALGYKFSLRFAASCITFLFFSSCWALRWHCYSRKSIHALVTLEFDSKCLSKTNVPANFRRFTFHTREQRLIHFRTFRLPAANIAMTATWVFPSFLPLSFFVFGFNGELRKKEINIYKCSLSGFPTANRTAWLRVPH